MAKKPENQKIDFKHNFKVYFSILKNYKSLFIFTMLSVLLVELTYIADKFIFKGLIDKGTFFSQGELLRSEFIRYLLILAVLFMLVLIVRTILKWIFVHLINRLDADMMFDLKRRFFNHILGLSYDFHTNNKTGALISRMVRGGKSLESLTDTIVFYLAPLVFQTVITVSAIFFFDAISAVVILLMIVAFVTYCLLINNIQQSSRLEFLRREDIEKASISDIFSNIVSIKCFGKERKTKTVFAKTADLTKWASLKNWNYFRWLDAGQALILGIGTFFLIYFPIKGLLNGTTSIGTLVFIYTSSTNIMGPLFSFVFGIRQFYEAMGDSQDLFKYEKVKNEIDDVPNAKRLHIREGAVDFKKVSFSYNNKIIFSDLNLKIPARKKIALIGPSGGGKTTLIKLLYRLYDINSGEILIDGKNIKSFKQESVREEMSLVPQECILFDDTIYNNIAFSKSTATKAEVMKAIKQAQLLELIKKLPEGENTVVGERGMKLSGGEKQRVSIARAILANKKVLVLDEATSALDSKTEHDIQKELNDLMKNRTSIVIAHRLSTIMSADMIVVLDKGLIIQMGTHNQLIRQEGMYRKLWHMQKGGYIK